MSPSEHPEELGMPSEALFKNHPFNLTCFLPLGVQGMEIATE